MTAEERPIRLLIVDDHAMFRKGIRAILEMNPGIEVVGEAADGQEAVRAARALQPDVILMDIMMPNLDGVAATWIIKHELQNTQVIILTMYQADENVFGGLKSGAHGYFLKESPPEDLIKAIHLIHQGQAMIDPKIAVKLLAEFARLPVDRHPPAAEQLFETLTPREREILELVAKGYKNKRLADALAISESTVKAHLRSIYRKLHINSRLEAVLFTSGVAKPLGAGRSGS